MVVDGIINIALLFASFAPDEVKDHWTKQEEAKEDQEGCKK